MPVHETPPGLAQVNALSQAAFTRQFGDVFEHAPWVAGDAWSARPFRSMTDLHEAMVRVMREAPPASQLALMRAHPELAPRAQRSSDLADFSRHEQAGAGLDTVTAEEGEQLLTLNRRYREKFGFPCIIAVSGLDKKDILSAMAARLMRDHETEYEENLEQIARIAGHRLAAMLDPG